MVHQRQHAADTRKPYSGLSRSMVIAIDVGTTFSGVSYAILEPGEIPKIHSVTRFPGQEHVAGNSKIPSVIFYDKYGNLMAAGAEAETSTIITQAEDDNWIKVELFKLRLRPRTMQLNMNGMRLSPLPKRKTPVHVFGDFLNYMFRCTRSFICDTHANGVNLWNNVESDIQFVLSHPNGWEGPQQTRMRNAAVYGKLVSDSDAGRARIRFVTEGEASLHACVLNGLAADVISNPSKHGFLIADAGGGTLDISAYAIKGTQPLTMEEIAPPDCIFAGSVFVSRRAREFLEDKLKNSRYGSADSLDHITRKFDETTKRLFRDRNELQFIPFGSPLDKDPSVGIRSGQLRLTGNEVANLFEPSVDAAVTTIKRQIDASNGMIRSVFLVGGYAASPWLFSQLQERLAPVGVTVNRPDSQTSKAVAEGAIGFYCDHHVSARMSKFMYGVEFLREMDPSDPDHTSRRDKLCELPSGPKLLPDAFDCILARGIKVKESTVFTRKYCTELTNLSMLSVFEVEIWCYRGGNKIPKWINRHDDHFSTLCVVQADLSLLNGSAEPKMGKGGKKYWTIVFSVEIHFGLTEFKARIKWMDNGQVKYGPAVIVYNERGHRVEDEDLDLYPEDDQSHTTSRTEKNRSDRHSPVTSSRPRTPVDSHLAPTSTIIGGTSSRRTSNAGLPDSSRMERASSKGYAPSVAPSVSGRGGYAPSEPDRKKGKDRESRYEERGAATPADKSRSSAYGTSPRPPSVAQSDMYGSTWGAPQGGNSAAPSVRPPASRGTSYYGGGEPVPSIPQDYAAPDQSWGQQPPGSFMDEQRQSHMWEQPSAQPSPQQSFKDPQRSPYPHDQSMEHHPTDSAQRSPFMPDHQPPSAAPDFGHAPQFNIERPRSSIGGNSMFGDRPKSAFGEHPPSMFGNDPPPAMFGDSGPAAEAGLGTESGGPTGMFGDPPPSVFGEAATPTAGEASAAGDSWGFEPPAPSPTVPAAAPAKKGKKKKEKEKEVKSSPIPPSKSAKTSPIPPSVKSAFGEEPPPSPAPASLWGTKEPSPLNKGKPLSPLNPAAQFNNEQGVEPPQDQWGFDTGNGGSNNDVNTGGDTGWGFPSNDNQGTGTAWGQVAEQPPTAPEPEPPMQHEVVPPPVEEPAVEEPMFTTGKKKKGKKGSTATTPVAKSQEPSGFNWGKTAEEQSREDEERQAEEKKAQEEQDRLAQAAEAAAQKANKEEEENARLADEANKRQEEEAAAALAQPASNLFGDNPVVSGGLTSSSSLNPPDKPWVGADTGGGDDSWGAAAGAPGGWGFGGADVGKKKKGKAAKPSAFGIWGGAGGEEVEETQQPAEPASGRASGLFGNLPSFGGFGFGGSTANTPNKKEDEPFTPIALENIEHPAPVAAAPEQSEPVEEPQKTESGEGEEPPAEAAPAQETPAAEEGDGFDDAWGAPVKGKKKKKKDEAPMTPVGETPASGEAAPDDYGAPITKKKKKKGTK